jgi:hypothetical protein
MFRKKIKAEEIGHRLYVNVRQARTDGYPAHGRLFPADAVVSVESVKDELLYLDVFASEAAVRTELGSVAEKPVLLAPFWAGFKKWLQQNRGEAIAERRVLLDGRSRVLPSEAAEDCYARLKRRLQVYSECAHDKHPLGDDFWIGAHFLGLCGSPGGASLADISSFLAARREEVTSMLQAQKIV